MQIPLAIGHYFLQFSYMDLIVLFAFIEFREGRDFHSGWLHL